MTVAGAVRYATHVLSAAEIRDDAIETFPDLAPYLYVGGSNDPATRLYLPAGTLAPFQPGDLVAISVGGAEATVSAVARDQLVRPRVELRTWMRRYVIDQQLAPGGLLSLIKHVCALDPEFGRSPTLPLDELLSRYRITQVGDRVALENFDVRGALLAEHAKFLVAAYGMPETEALAVSHIHQAVDDLLQAKGAAVQKQHTIIADFANEVRSSEGVNGLVAYWQFGDHDPRHVSGVLERVASTTTSHPAAVLAWARATLASAEADSAQASQLAIQALEASDRWTPAITIAAEVAADRGDTASVRRLLSHLPRRVRKDPPAGSVLAALSQEAEAPALGAAAPTVRVLYRKAERFLRSDAHARVALVAAIHDATGGGEPTEWVPDVGVSRLMADPLVTSAVLLEGRMLERFLTCKRDILPAHEVKLLTSWVTARRHCYEVVAVDSRMGAVLRHRESRTERECLLIPEFGAETMPGDTVIAWIVDAPGGLPVALSVVCIPGDVAPALQELISGEVRPADVVIALALAASRV